MPKNLQLEHLGVWAMADLAWRGLLARIQASGPELKAAVGARASEPAVYEMLAGGVALIDIVGVISKYGGWWASSSTLELRRILRVAEADRDVRAILLRIDSPGGSVAGVDDLAGEVARINAIKPIRAYIEDLGASAAYYVASQAGRIYANGSALVGSIGTYGLIYDWSGLFAAAGVKAVLVKAGEFKGMGALGTEITPEQISEFQREVDSINERFIAAVAAGRGLTEARARDLADGRIHIAAEAVSLGLIDGVRTLDDVIAELGKQAGRATPAQTTKAEPRKDPTMAEQPENIPEPAATLAELQRELPKADAAFIVRCLGQGCTLQQATRAWAEQLQVQLEAAQAASKPGLPALGGPDGPASESSSDAIETWDRAVAGLVSAGRTKAQAIAQVVREQPELHAAYIEAYNGLHRPARRR